METAKKMRLPDLHQSRALADQGHDLRHAWHEPRTKGGVGRGAHAQPHDPRPVLVRMHTLGKSLVLGHDDAARGLCVPPDRTVIGITQADLAHCLGFAAGFGEPTRKRRRQLGIDQKFHRLATSTG